MIIDTHSHITEPQYAPDRKEVIERLEETDTIAITCGLNLSSSKDVFSLIQESNYVYGSIGIHPSDAGKEDFDQSEFEKLLHERVVAIGELGIDYYHTTEYVDNQYRLFDAQMHFAKKHNLPVIIHCRGSKDSPDDAFHDLIDLLKKHDNVRKGVVHSFTGNETIANEFIKLGYYLGFNGIITFDKTEQSKTVLNSIPYDKILIETDSPYLSPVPYRGKRNEPSRVIHVAEHMATLLEKDVEDVVSQTTLNAKTLFGIK